MILRSLFVASIGFLCFLGANTSGFLCMLSWLVIMFFMGCGIALFIDDWGGGIEDEWCN